MRILVTGGAGFIGSHIAQAYADAGHEVAVLDSLFSGHEENVPDGVSLLRADVRSAEGADAVADFAPEVINHHAAQMNVRVSVDDPLFDADVNILGLINIIERARKSGLKRVLFASSGGTVYGEPETLPATEEFETHPVCPYGVSKLTSEHYLYYYSRIHGVDYVALRYSNVYGPRQDPHGEAGVIAIFCQNLLADKDVTIFGDGLQTRDYVFVGDVVRANVAALEGDFRGSVNIGTGKESNVVELYDRVKELVGGKGKAVHGPAKDGEVRRNVLDVSKAGAVLGWTPTTELSAGLVSTVDFFRTRS
ncbi:MAG: NAD-dependent epimerase/dehydratase family protein [Myxococcales bacterium]|jgi:UDP-glucose 4-epimerase|nr:MAG: NAD-dependent epimerase/dehydratase family protein [Myxococcales bacterium]